MQVISLFSGIGGFELAARSLGWDNVVSCEINPFGRRVLEYHFPESYHHDDIHTLNYEKIKEKSRWNPNEPTIVVGGFPCQPYSLAGKRLGKEDDRHLFPEMLRIIREVKPKWVVGENVFGLVNWNGGLVFHEIQTDLEAEGYEVQAYVLAAVSVNAPHKRDRVWIVAHSKSSSDSGISRRVSRETAEKNEGREKSSPASEQQVQLPTIPSIVFGNTTNSECIRFQEWNKTKNISKKKGKAHRERGESAISFETISSGFGGSNWQNFPTQPPICGGNDGIPKELDSITLSKWREEAVKAYGNAIVPQVAIQIFKAIQEYENNFYS